MNANDPNVALLEVVAERFGDDLRDEMVFVGDAVSQERLPALLGKLHSIAGIPFPSR